jgi:hypothetical protein
MLKTKIKFLSMIAGLVSILAIAACSDDDPPLPDNLVSFETATIGLSGDVDDIQINVTLTRAVAIETTVQISFNPTGVVYGDDFTIAPAPTGNTFSVVIPSNTTTASFTVERVAVELAGTESIAFEITNAGESGAIIGTTKIITLSFSDIISEGSQLTLQGRSTDTNYSPAAGINYANSAFADFSANSTHSVDRKNWALGFYSGNDFSVILNHSFQVLAAASDKTDIDAVTQADAEASGLYNFNAFAAGNPNGLDYNDSWDGDLTKTAIASVSVTDSENKVYFIRTENGPLNDASKWYKVRVLRNGDGYRLLYAKVTEATHQTVEISKDTEYNFEFVSLDNATDGASLNIEPQKAKWDIEWSYSTYNSGLNTPYWFQDFVLLNYAAGAQASEIIKATPAEAETSYASFAEADLTGLTFLQTRDAIGSKWRATTGDGIKRERFYVVKDTDGNIYKLRFLTMGVGDAGERGRPVIEYALVKKAS